MVDPTSGPPGTDLTVSGGGCNGTAVLLELEQGSIPLASGSATPDTAGAWSGGLSVPDDPSLAGAILTVSADCVGGDPDPAYGSGSFSVDEDPTMTTTTTTTSTTTTSTTAPGEPGPSSTTTTTEPATTSTTQPPMSDTPATPMTMKPKFTG